ncbi:MAG TPA: hypothetical protein VNG29_00730 [Candidatus Paceibacterota bacterium]|nr:hypothetical protein [Candidatus Paceibacterota bacterium]
MKKIAFLAIGIVAVFGFAGLTSHAQAAGPAASSQAGSLPASQVMGATNTQVLSQSLTVLGTVLDELNAKIDANQSPADIAGTNENLAAIHGELAALNGTIASLADQSKALAQANAPAQSPVIAQISAVTAAPAPETSALAPAPAANNEVASAALVGGLENFVWPAIIVLAIVLGILFFRKMKTPAPVVEYDAAETFASLPTITDY